MQVNEREKERNFMNKSYNLFGNWNTKQLQISEANLQTLYYTNSSDLVEERMRAGIER